MRNAQLIESASSYLCLFLFVLHRLLNSNTFSLISDNAFAGLGHLQYLWVCFHVACLMDGWMDGLNDRGGVFDEWEDWALAQQMDRLDVSECLLLHFKYDLFWYFLDTGFCSHKWKKELKICSFFSFSIQRNIN